MAPQNAGSSDAYAVLLAGDAITLGHAEMAALEAVDNASGRMEQSTHRIRLTSRPFAASRCAQALEWGTHWGSSTADASGITELATHAADATDGKGSVGVRVTRYENGIKAMHQTAAVAIGQALKDAGHTINLSAPDHWVYCWIGPETMHVGRVGGTRDAAHEQRTVEQRGHFSPIGLHPRRAASLVHLARVPVGGTLLDPFCGTGGIVLEAAAEGYAAIGSDLDSFMVQGTMQALTDSGPEPLAAMVFQSDIGAVPELVGTVQGIATDMPYGKASSTDREALSTLYSRALEAFSALLAPGGLAVVGHLDATLLAGAAEHGMEIATWGDASTPDVHEEYVHGSMTRRYAVLRRR